MFLLSNDSIYFFVIGTNTSSSSSYLFNSSSFSFVFSSLIYSICSIKISSSFVGKKGLGIIKSLDLSKDNSSELIAPSFFENCLIVLNLSSIKL